MASRQVLNLLMSAKDDLLELEFLELDMSDNVVNEDGLDSNSEEEWSENDNDRTDEPWCGQSAIQMLH